MQATMPSPTPALPKLLLYLAAVMLGGALLAAPLFDLGQATLAWLKANPAGQTSVGAWLLKEIQRAHFTRYFNRAVLVCALAFIWPFLRWVHLERGMLPTWRPLRAGLITACGACLLSASLLLLMGFSFHWLGAYQFRPQPGWTKLSEPLTAALGASLVEEVFFRGLLLGLLLRTMSARRAVLWATFVFAVVHFMKPPEGWQIADDQVVWYSGFTVLGQIARGFADIQFLLAEFATLFAVGWVLTQVRMRTGSLWSSIGLHAGWVFGLKWFSGLVVYQSGWLPWIGPNLKVGIVPLIMVLITGLLALAAAARLQSGTCGQGLSLNRDST